MLTRILGDHFGEEHKRGREDDDETESHKQETHVFLWLIYSI
jgi:hypothetical protein